MKRTIIERRLAEYLAENFFDSTFVDMLRRGTSADKLSKSSLNFLISGGYVTLPKPTDKRTDWQRMTDEVYKLIERLQKKPKSKRGGYRLCPSSILNAYREGDVTFDEAVNGFNALKKWKKEKTRRKKRRGG